MAPDSDPTFLAMHALRLKGFAEPAAIGEVTGQCEEEVSRVLHLLTADDLVSRRDGRISGWALTPAGRGAHAKLLIDDRSRAPEAAIDGSYGAFLAGNEPFKQLCTDWQLRPVGTEQVPNDHTDASYDAAIIQRLQAHHREMGPALQALAAVLSRFAAYEGRFSRALERLVAGDRTAFTRPLAGSYHDVWMELHQDLLLTLGRDRESGDGH